MSVLKDPNNPMFRTIPKTPFEEYKELLKEWFILERDDQGILTVRMHHEGDKPAMWCYGLHRGLGQLCKYVKQDKDNQVMIITGTGDQWIGMPDMKYISLLVNNSETDPHELARQTYDEWYIDGKELLNGFFFDLEIPTIAAINGPTIVGHMEFAMACDLTLCTPDVYIREGHFGVNDVPGDGLYLVLKHLLGEKRASYMVYTGCEISAKQALDWGLVNEIVERKDLYARAYELAQQIMKQSYHTRRLTHMALTKSWREDVVKDFDFQFALEGWAASMVSQAQGAASVQDQIDNFNETGHNE